MPLNDATRTYPRTLRRAVVLSPEDAEAIFCYRKPLAERVAMWFFKYGWALVLLAVFLLSGCADDLQAHADVQADLAAAIHQTAKGGIHE